MAKFGKMERQYDLDEPKHECKLCSKSFSSGRSLGGHMRSHLTSSSADSEDRRDREVKKPLKASSSPTTACGYGLRENPKKTRRGLEFGRDRSLEEEEEFDCRDSQFWSGDSSSHSSDTETGFPNRKKSQSKSDVERELEEVAICLMMLTRDFTSASDVVIDSSSMADSSNNKILLGDGDSHSPPKRESARAGPYVSGNFDGQSRMNRDGLGRVEIREMSLGKSLQVKASDVSSSSSRRELADDSDDLQVGRRSSKKLLAVLGVDRDLDKGSSSRFECQTCNKIFHSYQALGGHRASHRKSKACFGSKVNSIEPQPGTEADTINQLKKRRKKQTEGAEHECSICRQVFPSGQALGGHKRSHIPEAKTAQARLPSIPEPAPVHQVRDFLDLNLPAPLEEEDDCSSIVKFKPWWVGRSHRQEPAIGLIAS